MQVPVEHIIIRSTPWRAEIDLVFFFLFFLPTPREKVRRPYPFHRRRRLRNVNPRPLRVESAFVHDMRGGVIGGAGASSSGAAAAPATPPSMAAGLRAAVMETTLDPFTKVNAVQVEHIRLTLG